MQRLIGRRHQLAAFGHRLIVCRTRHLGGFEGYDARLRNGLDDSAIERSQSCVGHVDGAEEIRRLTAVPLDAPQNGAGIFFLLRAIEHGVYRIRVLLAQFRQHTLDDARFARLGRARLRTAVDVRAAGCHRSNHQTCTQKTRRVRHGVTFLRAFP